MRKLRIIRYVYGMKNEKLESFKLKGLELESFHLSSKVFNPVS